MTIERETYTEIVHSMVYAMAIREMNLVQITAILYACAQESTTEEALDITQQVRERLTDWSQEDRGRIIAIEMIIVKFKCQKLHGPCKKGEHAMMLTRIIGTQEWRPEKVSSSVDFNEAVLDAMHTIRPSADGETAKVIHNRGLSHTLSGLFAEMFGEETETIEDKVRDFASELDALFPSNPQPGKEEGHESS